MLQGSHLEIKVIHLEMYDFNQATPLGQHNFHISCVFSFTHENRSYFVIFDAGVCTSRHFLLKWISKLL